MDSPVPETKNGFLNGWLYFVSSRTIKIFYLIEAKHLLFK